MKVTECAFSDRLTSLRSGILRGDRRSRRFTRQISLKSTFAPSLSTFEQAPTVLVLDAGDPFPMDDLLVFAHR